MADATLKMLLLGEDRTASRALKGVGDQAAKTEKHASHLGASFAKAGKVAAIGLAGGLTAAGVAMVGMVKNGADDLAAQRRLAVALHNTTGATKEQVKGVESWISKQGVALGVTDDELRPALQRLVQSTGNVSKAQKLAAVAMDASAGSGKSLKVVSEAIAKAHNGNLGALSRLGVKIKDTNGKTLTFNQAMKEMGKTFQGQAAAGANTFDGKMRRLKLVFDETKETIGQKVIPILTKLATWFLSDGIPMISRFGEGISKVSGFVKDHRRALIALTATLAALVAITRIHAAVMAVDAAGGMLKYLKATRLVTAATKVYAAVQWLLNAALDANPIGLVIVAVAALAAGLVYAYKHSETFRNIVQGAFKAVGAAASHMWNDVIKPVFKFIVSAWLSVTGALINGAARAFGWVPGLGPKLRKAAAWFNDFRNEVNHQLSGLHDGKVKVSAPGADHAISQLSTLNNLLNVIKHKPVRMNVPSPGVFNPHNAVGTSNFSGGSTWVGERGSELVTLPRGSRVDTADRLRGMGRGGNEEIHVSAPVVLKLDSREVWQGMLQLKRNRGGVTLGLA